MAVTEVTLKTTGLHCGSCSKMVDMTVGELDGVDSVATDHASGDTRVAYDTARVSVDQIISAIRSAGYDAENPTD